jgi:hypothetical protein
MTARRRERATSAGPAGSARAVGAASASARRVIGIFGSCPTSGLSSPSVIEPGRPVGIATSVEERPSSALFDFWRRYGFGLLFPGPSGCAVSVESGAASSPDTSPAFGGFAGTTTRDTLGCGAFPGLPGASGATGTGATAGRVSAPRPTGATGTGTTSRATPGCGGFPGLPGASGATGTGATAGRVSAPRPAGATGTGTTSRATPGCGAFPGLPGASGATGGRATAGRVSGPRPAGATGTGATAGRVSAPRPAGWPGAAGAGTNPPTATGFGAGSPSRAGFSACLASGVSRKGVAGRTAGIGTAFED